MGWWDLGGSPATKPDYEQGLKQVGGLSDEVKKLATEIRDNESAHIDGLAEAIKGAGGEPTQAPKVDFGDAFSSEDAFLELAQTLEDTGVSAYNGAGPSIESMDVLAAAGSIVQIEARHAALVRLQRGESPAPDAYDPALEKQEVLDAVQPFVKSYDLPPVRRWRVTPPPVAGSHFVKSRTNLSSASSDECASALSLKQAARSLGTMRPSAPSKASSREGGSRAPGKGRIDALRLRCARPT